ncbi:MAG: hypothetical protein R3302_00215 [Sulfurimonadaceae bacterium]|nr:hypothetical protein [Sulfurimonadaceae bacterium]
MDDEKIFGMLDQCIEKAVFALENGQRLEPFAMTLEADDTTQYIAFDEADHEKHYELLLEALRAEAKNGGVKAVALIARVTIPENFNPTVPEGIRIHVEERASSHEKIAARLLYIPYQLFRKEGDEKVNVHLHHPIPVGLPSEIFV